MRIRNKPWATKELNLCPYFIREPESHKGSWHTLFKKEQPLYIELGCGKGFFIAGAAVQNPGINFLGIDIKDAVLGPAKRNIDAAFTAVNGEPSNVILTAFNIELMLNYMGPADAADRIYINFCNPWPKKKHQKRRLTYPRQLENYKVILKPGGKIFFKTDDDSLFEDSIGYFNSCGFKITYKTYDLHAEKAIPGIMTEHEIMFTEKGIKIKALTAEFKP
mgnify:FL=1|jgi:tRNA (guanine-N7-)-methyltransferase